MKMNIITKDTMFGQSGRNRTSIMRAKFSRTAIVLRSE